MRSIVIRLTFWLISTSLVSVAVLVAWARSRPAEPMPGPAATASSSAATPEPGPLAAETWALQCASCHGAGESRGRSIPSLHGFAVELLESAGGRRYLVDLLLDGRVRRVVGGEVSFVPSHPDYARLSDEELAAVLNHMLTSWGNAELLPERERPYTADEIASRRPAPTD